MLLQLLLLLLKKTFEKTTEHIRAPIDREKEKTEESECKTYNLEKNRAAHARLFSSIHLYIAEVHTSIPIYQTLAKYQNDDGYEYRAR